MRIVKFFGIFLSVLFIANMAQAHMVLISYKTADFKFQCGPTFEELDVFDGFDDMRSQYHLHNDRYFHADTSLCSEPLDKFIAFYSLDEGDEADVATFLASPAPRFQSSILSFTFNVTDIKDLEVHFSLMNYSSNEEIDEILTKHPASLSEATGFIKSACASDNTLKMALRGSPKEDAAIAFINSTPKGSLVLTYRALITGFDQSVTTVTSPFNFSCGD